MQVEAAHAGDAQVQGSVERMMRVIELARTIRERRNKSLKMPVRELVVVHTDEAFLADLTGEWLAAAVVRRGRAGVVAVVGLEAWRLEVCLDVLRW